MASITEPQPVLARGEPSKNQTAFNNGIKGKMRRDTISGKLKFWAGNHGNDGEKRKDAFKKLDMDFDKYSDMGKDLGEGGDGNFSHDPREDPLVCPRLFLIIFCSCIGDYRISARESRILTKNRTGHQSARPLHS